MWMMFWFTSIAYGHTFIFKYQVDNLKYVKFLIKSNFWKIWNEFEKSVGTHIYMAKWTLILRFKGRVWVSKLLGHTILAHPTKPGAALQTLL